MHGLTHRLQKFQLQNKIFKYNLLYDFYYDFTMNLSTMSLFTIPNRGSIF